MNLIRKYKKEKENLMESISIHCMLVEALENNANWFLQLALIQGNQNAVDYLEKEVSYFEELEKDSFSITKEMILIEAGL